MSFIDDVACGAYGVRFQLPGSFVRQHAESVEGAIVVDRERGLALQLGWCPHRLDLSPAHDELLRQDIERAARDLFNQVHAHRPPHCSFHERRTDDPEWSPVIEASRVAVSGAPALEVVHRMSYAPGDELVMGHLLIPTRLGLFEFRPFATATITGMREAALTHETLSRELSAPLEELERILRREVTQAKIDDPALDATFPTHPLSVVRSALRWLREGAGVAVTEPAETTPPGALELPGLGCAFSPPPRYLLHEAGARRAQLARLCLATTDGLSLLTVLRAGSGSARASALRSLGEELGRSAVLEGASGVDISSREVPGPHGRTDAEIHVRFVRDDGLPWRTAFRWFVDERGERWALAIGASQSSPEAELVGDLDALVRSFRLLGSGQRKPWWKLW